MDIVDIFTANNDGPRVTPDAVSRFQRFGHSTSLVYKDQPGALGTIALFSEKWHGFLKNS
jgi:hypothetical protein